MFKKKKGSVMVYFIWFLIFFTALSLLLLNFAAQMGVSQRVNGAAESAAKARATAIDLPKKEDTGEIWIMQTDNHDGMTDTGEKPYIDGTDSAFQAKAQEADAYAKAAADNAIQSFSGKNSAGENIVANTQICFDYAALPVSASQTVMFSCKFSDGTSVSRNYTLSPVTDNTKGNVKVKSAVFVGIKVVANDIFSLKSFFGAASPYTFTSSAVAYPQIDECVNGMSGCSY